MFPLSEAVGEMPLPLSLETVGTDRSLRDNEGAVGNIRGGGWVTKNASCSELGDEDASCSEHRGSQLLGVDRSICASSSQVRVVSYDLRATGRTFFRMPCPPSLGNSHPCRTTKPHKAKIVTNYLFSIS